MILIYDLLIQAVALHTMSNLFHTLIHIRECHSTLIECLSTILNGGLWLPQSGFVLRLTTSNWASRGRLNTISGTIYNLCKLFNFICSFNFYVLMIFVFAAWIISAATFFCVARWMVMDGFPSHWLLHSTGWVAFGCFVMKRSNQSMFNKFNCLYSFLTHHTIHNIFRLLLYLSLRPFNFFCFVNTDSSVTYHVQVKRVTTSTTEILNALRGSTELDIQVYYTSFFLCIPKSWIFIWNQ